jgi:hypothetical protein
MMIRIGFTLILLGLLLTGSVNGQSAERIVKQAAKALGGEKALRNVRSRQIQGTITDLQSGGTGNYQASITQPNLYSTTFDLRGLERSAGYNGKSGWTRDSRDGLRTLTGGPSRDFQAEAIWQNLRWFNYKKEKAKLTFGGQTTINGISANTVVYTSPKNVKIKAYFDVASGMPIREEFPAGDQTRTFDYTDFRLVDGVKVPHQIHLTTGDQQYQIKIERVIHNSQIDRSIFDFPKTSTEPLPDINALLKEVGQNEDEVERLLEKYTYTATQTKREVDSSGQIREKESEVNELTFYKGYRIRRLVAKNGKPLTANEEEKETKQIEKRIREIEKKEAEREKKEKEQGESSANDSGDNDRRISIAEIFRASKLINPRRERFRSRDCIVFDFEPLPGYKPQNRNEKLFGKMAGAMWIDEADKQVARLEARLIEAYKIAGGLFASLKEGGTFVLEQDRINNEIWLPTRADIDLGIKVFLLKGLNFNLSIAYGDYKRFSVESENEKLTVPTEKTSKP